MSEKKEKIDDVEAQSNRIYKIGKKNSKKISYSYLITILSILSISIFTFIIKSSYPCNQITSKNINSYNLSSVVVLKALEKNYAGKWLKDYSEDNQLAGTNFKMVNYTLNKFKEFGLENSYIDQYTSYISYPLENNLSLINSKNNSIIFKPSLIEDTLKEDPNSSYKVPAFLGYAANGNVTSEFIYCNYGRYEDFQKLIELGIDLKDKIAIVRYGAIYRGLKIKFAQDVGMSGVLLYSDPKDDGEVIIQNGFEPYPKGFARNPSSIQRGSALFLSMTPGDPMTPGYAIKPGEDKERIDPFNTIPKIPALPISYREITPILQKLSGFGPKIEAWDGLIEGYNFTIGPNPNISLNLYNKQEFNISIMNNIMGKIEGYDDSKFILIGNHHDSWTPSAADPHSGSATMLEMIRAFGELVETGWKPKISIIFGSWDGEEYGLIGSTEYAEYYENELKRKCIAYINTDVSTIGNILNLQSSPILNKVLLDSTKELNYPNSTYSLYDHFIEKKGKIGTLGSGSDYTVFLEHLGIPSVDMGFSNDLKNSSVYQYHSLYDSYYWMSKFGDPGFIYHNLLSKLMSLVVLHLTDEPVLRLRTNDYAIELEKYFNDLNIPKEWLHSSSSSSCGNKSLKKLVKSISVKLITFKEKTFEFDEYLNELVKLFDQWDSLTYWQRIKLYFKTKSSNSILQFFERHFLDNKGLNNRPWFKHVVFASGRYTGYKGQELPGLAEAIEDVDVKDFSIRLHKFSHMLDTLIRMTS